MSRKSRKTPFFIQLDGAPWFNKERLQTAKTNTKHPAVVAVSQRLEFRLLTLYFSTEEDKQKAVKFWEKRNAYVIASTPEERPKAEADTQERPNDNDSTK